MSLVTRGFTAVVLAAAFTGMLAPPASAGQGAASQVAVYLPDVLMDVESTGTLVSVLATASQPVVLDNFVLKVDFSGLAGVATVTPDPAGGCDVAASVMTCDLGTLELDPFATLEPVLAVVPAVGAAAGATGKWKATISAKGLEPTSMESAVTLAEGVDLGVPRDTVPVKGSPGSALPLPLEINNVGERTADGAVALIAADDTIAAAKQYSNCTFRNGRIMSCTFDEQLASGAGYSTNEPAFRLRSDATSPADAGMEILWVTKAEFEALKKLLSGSGQPDFFGSPGTGDRLRLVQNPSLRKSAAQVDIDGTNNGMVVSAKVEGRLEADLAAIGATGSGSVGQVVTLNLGLRNAGPTLDLHGDGDDNAAFDLTLPQGSSLAEIPAGCIAMKQVGDDPQEDPQPGNLATRMIRCGNGNNLFPTGTDWTLPIKLRIDQVITAATGTVSVATKCDGCPEDRNPANNTANVVLNAALPTTGVQTGLLAGTGVLLALAGVAAFALGRRRRFKVTESE